MVLVLSLIACSPEPASIKFEGADTITVHTLDAVDVSKTSVLDKDGKALEPQPAVTWSVSPDSVAKLDGAKVTPVASGEAKVEAKVGEIKAAYKFVVALPDKLEIAGYDAATPWPVGGNAQLTGAVKAGETVLDGQTITWASSDVNIVDVDAAGLATGKADGKATVTATSGALTATVEVTIGGAPATAAVE
jgi:hypothetical protein